MKRGRTLPSGEASFNQLFLSYKNNARYRNHSFELTKKQFKELTQQNCFYCNKEPSQSYKRLRYNGSFVYNGIDRKDNSKGYTVENCVSCCKFCNQMKHHFSQELFFEKIKVIYEFHSLGNVL